MSVRRPGVPLLCIAVFACTSPAERDIPSEESPGLLQGDPVLTIGAWPVAEETHVIENPVRVLLPGDSTLIVLDARSREIRAFGLDGTHLWRAGGIGEGPGEFPSPALSLFSLRAGAELVAVDASATRANIYTRRGSLIESLGLPSAADHHPDVYGVLDVDPPRLVVGYDAPFSGTGVTAITVLALPLVAGAAPDTLGVFRGPTNVAVRLESGWAWRSDPDSGGVVAAARGNVLVTAGVDDSVRIRTPEGIVMRSVALPGSPSGLWHGAAIASVLFDDRGRLWLTRHADDGNPGRPWVALDLESGQWTATFRTFGQTINGMGRELVAGPARGTMDESVVHVFRLSDRLRNR